VDEGLRQLAERDANAAQALQRRVASAVEQRSAAYVGRHGERSMRIGAVLFDRGRRLCAEGPCGAELLQAFRA
jgi:cobalt-precorrin-5B (C1)-methyltransferase